MQGTSTELQINVLQGTARVVQGTSRLQNVRVLQGIPGCFKVLARQGPTKAARSVLRSVDYSECVIRIPGDTAVSSP